MFARSIEGATISGVGKAATDQRLNALEGGEQRQPRLEKRRVHKCSINMYGLEREGPPQARVLKSSSPAGGAALGVGRNFKKWVLAGERKQGGRAF